MQLAQKQLWDPRQRRLATKGLQRKQRVHDGEAWDDPFVAASQNGRLVSTLLHGQLKGLNAGSATSDDENLLALEVDAVEVARVYDFTVKLLLIGKLELFGLAARASGYDETIKDFALVAIDDPPTVPALDRVSGRLVAGDGLDGRLEAGALVEGVSLPNALYVVEDLVSLGVSLCVADARVESVHDTADLETTGRVDLAPDPADVVRLFKDGDFEAMAEEMRGGRDTCDACADDCDVAEWFLFGLESGWERREEPRDDRLDELVDEGHDAQWIERGDRHVVLRLLGRQVCDARDLLEEL